MSTTCPGYLDSDQCEGCCGCMTEEQELEAQRLFLEDALKVAKTCLLFQRVSLQCRLSN